MLKIAGFFSLYMENYVSFENQSYTFFLTLSGLYMGVALLIGLANQSFSDRRMAEQSTDGFCPSCRPAGGSKTACLVSVDRP